MDDHGAPTSRVDDVGRTLPMCGSSDSGALLERPLPHCRPEIFARLVTDGIRTAFGAVWL